MINGKGRGGLKRKILLVWKKQNNKIATLLLGLLCRGGMDKQPGVRRAEMDHRAAEICLNHDDE